MDTSALRTGSLAAAVVLGLAIAGPAAAATGPWSWRSSAPAMIWTRAGVVRVGRTTEIARARDARPRRRPAPFAHATRPSGTCSIGLDQRPDRRSPSSSRAAVSRAASARLRTTATPDRRANSAILAALAGVFYDAHAPPSRTRIS